LIEFLARALAAGVDMLQLRERDLSAWALLELADAVAPLARSSHTAMLINDRADVAACAGTGVHLTTRSLTPDVVRRAFGQEMLIGASTHNLSEAEAAEAAGANFIVFGPVFETASKKIYGPPVGVHALEAVTSRVRIPVLALGGIDLQNFRTALDAGAAGIAAISMFVEADDLQAVVNEIKAYGR
jgi:thiamine-phosphate pyrophosphorylase